MARHNIVNLYGKVERLPRIVSKENDNGTKKELASIVITTFRRYDSSDGKLRHEDAPIIETTDPELIAKIRTLKPNDVVEIRGTVRTKPVRKVFRCPECGELTSRNGIRTIVHPTLIKIDRQNLSDGEARELINDHIEMSNSVYVIGNLCADPHIYRKIANDESKTLTTYEIAVDRHLRLQDDSADSTSDYIWVKSYGGCGNEDYKRLKKGSCVAIEGFLQTRKYSATRTCDGCGKEITVEDASMEIVTMSSEYCRDFRDNEEAEKIWSQLGAKKAINNYEAYEQYQSSNVDALISQLGKK